MSPNIALSPQAANALRELLRGPATRPELSGALRVTKQTVSLAVAELEGRMLAEARAVQQGALGRSAIQYGLHSAAGWVAGIDLGSARLRVAATRLDGTVIGDRIKTIAERTAQGRWDDYVTVASGLLAQMEGSLVASHGPLLGVGLAIPAPVRAEEQLLPSTRDGGSLTAPMVLGKLSPRPVWAENDVSCEALAQPPSASAGDATVLHLHVGIGVGLAFVVNGRLIRGARGRAGEIRDLPAPVTGRGSSLELSIGAGGLLAAAGHSPGARLSGAIDDLFAAAAVGDPAAEHAIAQEADSVSVLVRQLVTILDPDVVVLSGQLAGRTDLSGLIADRCLRSGLAAPVIVDPLGDAAAVLGAAGVARDGVLALLAPK
ncbi:ROK family protein [Jatrophihabitans endophyticus]|uniref:ROK family protein n=1 Tax=Jatrophihabitans endophyticus TaxID=1206085 RepID=UPI0019DAE9DE|nr:ROK family protein [Jatrophihabitans endophyticus]MBE7188311.1 ROK family protein [Jatrophihabitans endophyticus]